MLINKKNLPLVAEDFMNDTHFEDVDIINELYENVIAYKNEKNEEKKSKVLKTYEKWYEHTVNHFKTEEDKMLEMNFPPYMMHQGEHESCLEKMRNILKYFDETNDEKALLEYLEKDLTNWLIIHIQTMDTVTAMFFKTGRSPCQSY